MFFNIDWAVKKVKDEVARNKKWVVICFLWSGLAVFQSVKTVLEIYGYSTVRPSVADILISLQESWYFGILQFPFFMLIILQCRKEDVNVQVIVRYQKRRQIVVGQALESIVYAIGISSFLVGIEVAIAGMSGIPWINWEERQGIYYRETGTLFQEKFWVVCIVLLMMYIVKFLMMTALMDIFQWYRRGMVFSWIAIVFFSVVEQYLIDVPVFHMRFAVRYDIWQPFWKTGLCFVIGVGIVIAEYLTDAILVRKMDFK